MITNNYDHTKEIRRSLCILRNAMVLLRKLWKEKSITNTTKKTLLHIVQPDFSPANCSSEFCLLTTIDEKNIEAFEL